MNKYLYILGLAGVALFSGCSNSDDLLIEDSSAVDKEKESVLIYEAGQNSEVPITLGAGQSRGYTRAVLNPTDASGSFNTEPGKHLGVFCLATGYQYPYSDPEKHPIENNWASDDTGLIVRMKNVAATVADGNVTFNDHDYYYPIGKWMEYNFYAYYPRQEETVTIDIDEETTETEKRLYFTENQVLERYYHIDGSQDIIWGMTDPSNAKYSDAPNYAKPFSAGYYLWKKDSIARKNPSDNIANYAPQFSFEHKMVQFRFFVKAADATVASKNIKVRDMNITNGINHLALIVANKSNSNFNGKLYWFGKTITTERMSIKEIGYDRKRFDKNGDGKLDSSLSITANAVNVNAVDGVGNPTDPSFAGYIMLAPPNVPKYNDRNSDEPEPNNTVYRLVLKVRYDGGASDVNVVKLLDPSVAELETFEEGQTYNIVIKIKSSDLGLSE